MGQAQHMTEGKKGNKQTERDIHNYRVNSWFVMCISDHVATALVSL